MVVVIQSLYEFHQCIPNPIEYKNSFEYHEYQLIKISTNKAFIKALKYQEITEVFLNTEYNILFYNGNADIFLKSYHLKKSAFL